MLLVLSEVFKIAEWVLGAHPENVMEDLCTQRLQQVKVGLQLAALVLELYLTSTEGIVLLERLGFWNGNE